jgi:hypothetical protein
MVLLMMTRTMVEGLQKVDSRNSTVLKDNKPHESNGSQQLLVKDAQENGQLYHDDNKKGTRNDAGESSSLSHCLPTEETVHNSTDATEPSLERPCLGNPISHGQVIDLSTQLRAAGLEPHRLEDLLRGSRVYVAPPPPKLEPVSDNAVSWFNNCSRLDSDTFSTAKVDILILE